MHFNGTPTGRDGTGRDEHFRPVGHPWSWHDMSKCDDLTFSFARLVFFFPEGTCKIFIFLGPTKSVNMHQCFYIRLWSYLWVKKKIYLPISIFLVFFLMWKFSIFLNNFDFLLHFPIFLFFLLWDKMSENLAKWQDLELQSIPIFKQNIFKIFLTFE